MFLKDKTILITRPKAQSVEFSSQLQALGAYVISLPLIELKPIHQKELQAIFSQQSFDWIIFTSYNAVNTFFQVIDKKNCKAKIAVVGKKTKESVEKLGLTVAFMPSEYKASVLGGELPVNANEKIFIPLSEIANDNLVEQLKRRNTEVTTLVTYQNSPIYYSPEALKKIIQQSIDFITFTSGSCVQAFVALELPTNNAALIYIGPETAKIAQKNNLRIDAVASEYTTDGLIDAIRMLMS